MTKNENPTPALCTWPSGAHSWERGRPNNQICTTCGAHKPVPCSICAAPAFRPIKPNIDPLCPTCQTKLLVEGMTIEQIQREVKVPCSIDGTPAAKPADPEIDPLCPTCAHMLDRGMTIDQIRKFRLEEPPQTSRSEETFWDYNRQAWGHPDEY